MSQFFISSTSGGGGGSITVMPDEGGAIGPTDNFGIIGATYGDSEAPIFETHNVGGNLVLEPRAYPTPYVVDPEDTIGMQGTYQTIQAAINAAVTDGASFGDYKTVSVRPGTYTENLTIPGGIMLVGQTIPYLTGGIVSPVQSTIINGNHTFTGNAVGSFQNINFISSSGDMFTGGTVVLYHCMNCFFGQTGDTIFTLSTISSYLSFLDCTFGAQGQSIFNLNQVPSYFVNCVFLQPCKITITGASLKMINCQNVASIVSTSSQLFIEGCSFLNQSETYCISGTASGIIKDTTFTGAIGVENTCTASLINCSSVGNASALIYENGTVFDNLPTTIGNVIPGKTVTLSGGGNNYNVSILDYYIGINNISGSAATINLPFSAGTPLTEGQTFIIQDIAGTAAANNLTINAQSTDTINGGASVVLSSNLACNTIRYYGSGKYFVTSSN